MEKSIYVIFNDSMDDCCSIIGYCETEEEADKYVNEYNEKVKYSWDELTWRKVPLLKAGDK